MTLSTDGSTYICITDGDGSLVPISTSPMVGTKSSGSYAPDGSLYVTLTDGGGNIPSSGPDVTAPTITSASTVSVNENVVLAFPLTTNESVTWSIIGGADASRLEISGSTLRWLSNGTKDFESPNDADANNIYLVQVRATDTAGNGTNQNISITVLNIDEVAPTITSSATVTNPENTPLALALTANEPVTWSIVGGADAARFEISDSTLRWLGNTFKDFESPNDADANNIYLVQVRATDLSGNTTNQNISVTVLDVLDTGTITRNIKTDYGALGDWQLVTDTVTLDNSFATGNRTLVTANPHFVSGDVGKYIGIEEADNTVPNSWLNTHLTTIATYISPTCVILTDSPTVAHSAATVQVEWGHDDMLAFQAFFNEFHTNKTSNVILIIPTGRYCATTIMPAEGGNYFFMGVKTLTVAGEAPVVFSDCLGRRGWVLGGGYFDQDYRGLIESVDAGATSVTLKTSADASKFSVGSWAWVTGFDLQGYGDPPNQYFVDYVYITDITGAVVTFEDPLQYSYKSTWPGVTNSYRGGEAQLRTTIMSPSYPTYSWMQWDCDHDYQNISVDSVYSVFNCAARNIKLSGGTARQNGPNISGNKNFHLVDYNVPQGWEVDKNTDKAVFDNVNFHRMFFQSPCMNELIVNNSTSDLGFAGTPKKLVVNNSTIGYISLGSYAYGTTEEVIITDSEITGNIDRAGLYPWNITAGGFISLVDGLFTIDRSAFGLGTLTWAVPGSWHGWGGGSAYVFSPPVFQVIDVWANEDESLLYVQIDPPLTGLPMLRGVFNTTGEATEVNQHPCPKLTLTNVTGCPNAVSASDFPPGLPWASRFKRTYTSGPWFFTDPRPHSFPSLGTITKVTIDVTKAYSGTNPALNFQVQLGGIIPDNSFGATKYLTVDAKTIGTRVITPTTVTGSTSGLDSLAAYGPWWIWPDTNQATFDLYIADEPESAWPNIILTVETDQGITYAPPAPTFATLDNPGPNATMSNGNLTVSYPGDAGTYSGSKSTAFRTTGKYYFEGTGPTWSASNSIGIAENTATYSEVLSYLKCSAVKGNGGIVTDGGLPGPWVGAGFSPGDIACCAFDLDARKVWFRRNGGAWNVAATGTQDPSTGAGGLTIGSGSFAPIIACNWNEVALMSANFGQTAYAQAKPIGFSDWPASSLREMVKAEAAEEVVKTIIKGALIKPLPGEPPP